MTLLERKVVSKGELASTRVILGAKFETQLFEEEGIVLSVLGFLCRKEIPESIFPKLAVIKARSSVRFCFDFRSFKSEDENL